MKLKIPYLAVLGVLFALSACGQTEQVQISVAQVSVPAAEAGPQIPGSYALVINSKRLNASGSLYGCLAYPLDVKGADAFDEALLAALDGRFDRVAIVGDRDVALSDSYDGAIFIQIRNVSSNFVPTDTGLFERILTVTTKVHSELYFSPKGEAIFAAKHVAKGVHVEPGYNYCDTMGGAMRASMQQASVETVRELVDATANDPQVRAFGSGLAGS